MTKKTPTVLAISLLSLLASADTSYANAFYSAETSVTINDVDLAESTNTIASTILDNVTFYSDSVTNHSSDSVLAISSESAILSNDEEDINKNNKEEQKEMNESPSPYANKLVVSVDKDSFLYIRANADTDSKALGKLYNGTEATIVKKGQTWTKIHSGSITGYVNNDFVLFDDDAYQMAKKLGKMCVKTTSSQLRVRAGAGTDSGILGIMEQSVPYEIVSSANKDWYKIKYTSKTTAYVSAKYVDATLSLPQAVPMVEKSISTEKSTGKNIAAKATNQKLIIPAGPTGSSKLSSYSDAYLLACAVHMEAGGESYSGKLGVANVILNRVKSSQFPNSISGVLLQRGQFPPATNGKLNRILKSGPNSQSLKAAKDALNGSNNIGSRLYFNGKSAIRNATLVIGGHGFK